MNFFDFGITEFLIEFGRQFSFFGVSMIWLHEANFLKGYLFTAIYMTAWFMRHPNREKHRETVLAIMIMCPIALLAGRILSLISPFRPRPMNVEELYSVMQFYSEPGHLKSWSSFPSDNAVMFLTLGTGLFFLSRSLGVFGVLYGFFGIALTRVYVGLHYPTDIIVGSIIGAVAAWTIHRPVLIERVIRPVYALKFKFPFLFYGAFFFICYQLATMYGIIRKAGSFLVDIPYNFLKTLF